MGEIIQYITEFLLYGHSEAAPLVGYTANEAEWQHYRVVIVPNGHLGQQIVEPCLSHPEIEVRTNPGSDKPLHIIHTDLIYNTFFFISRAEELINPQRDEHGRFLAKYSILGKNNRLMIPLIDEYSRMLMKCLDLPLPTPAFSHIYLTHDVDTIAHYRHLRGAIGGVLRGQWKKVKAAIKDIHNDPAFTFSWLISQDKQVPDAQSVYFIKRTNGKGFDYPQYDLQGRDFSVVKQLLVNSDAVLGLHSSYYGATGQAAQAAAESMPWHRSHYLRCSIDQMQQWADSRITDDFTMMFPDQVGFRLQTTRPVRWINPKTMQLTSLTLHPLTVMDCTLSNDNYMHLTEDEAYFQCQRLFEKVHQNAGEIVILWHNTTPTHNPYHRTLYPKLLALLSSPL